LFFFPSLQQEKRLSINSGILSSINRLLELIDKLQEVPVYHGYTETILSDQWLVNLKHGNA
jgi:hypothetical protein